MRQRHENALTERRRAARVRIAAFGGKTFSYALETVVSTRDLFDRLAAAEADGSGPEQIAQHPYGHAGYFFRNVANALGDYLFLARVKRFKLGQQFLKACSQLLARYRH
jgi:hypothetical protein